MGGANRTNMIFTRIATTVFFFALLAVSLASDSVAGPEDLVVPESVSQAGSSSLQTQLTQQPAYSHVGCFHDDHDRALPTLATKEFGYHGACTGSYARHRHCTVRGIQACYQYAKDHGFKVFALQDNGTKCWTGQDADKTYSKYGRAYSGRPYCPGSRSRFCCQGNGKGGAWNRRPRETLVNDVYRVGELTDQEKKDKETMADMLKAEKEVKKLQEPIPQLERQKSKMEKIEKVIKLGKEASAKLHGLKNDIEERGQKIEQVKKGLNLVSPEERKAGRS